MLMCSLMALLAPRVLHRTSLRFLTVRSLDRAHVSSFPSNGGEWTVETVRQLEPLSHVLCSFTTLLEP
jgi:hypothetical protein